MKIYDCLQGSEQWEQIRKGRPTASRFKDILTPAKLQLSKQREAYAEELALELCGMADEFAFSGNAATDWGNDNEDLGVLRYEQETGDLTETVGFVTPDDSTLYGCSPDRFVLVDGERAGLLEVKARSKRGLVHDYRYPVEAEKRHWLQCQAQLWITGLPWCDLYIFNPDLLQTLCFRIVPDEAAFKAFAETIPVFVLEVHDLAKLIQPYEGARL